MSEETVHNHDGFKGHGYVDGCPRCEWLQSTDAEKRRVFVLKEWLDNVNAAVQAQARDDTLWAVNIPGEEFKVGIGEAYIQQSLRRLHRVIELNDTEALKQIIAQANDEN